MPDTAPGSESRLDLLAPYAYLVMDWAGPIREVNATFLQWTGYERAEVVGRKTLADLMGKAAAIFGQTHLRPMLLEADEFHQVAIDVRRADGTRLPVLMNGVLDRDPGGRPQSIRIAMLDITERRMYEQQLLDAKRASEAAEADARRLATTLQATLIPPQPPTIAGLDLAASYRPAGSGTEVGGDFYDIFQVSADEWVVALGDVCGKGVDAAVVTALARYSLRAAVMETPSPAAGLELLNRVVLQHETDRFLSAVLARLSRRGEGWAVTLSTGGHPEPLVAQGGVVTPVPGTGALIGVFDALSASDEEVALGPGDTLVLYTDGITEARGDSEFFGEERFQRAVGRPHESAAQLVDLVMSEVMAFQDAVARDDIAIVVLRVPRSA